MLGLVMDNAVLNLTASTNSTSQSSSDDGSEIVLNPDLFGQYFLTAEINGQKVIFIVDTGSWSVALTQSDADAVGFPIHEMEYSGTAWAANGKAKYAPVMLDEIHVGDYVVNNVRGAIMGSPMKH